MARLTYPDRPLAKALALSLAAHLALFIPWQYGQWLQSSYPELTPSHRPPPLKVVLVPFTAGGNTFPPEQAILATEPDIEESPAHPTEVAKTLAPQASGIPLENLRYYEIQELDQRPVLTRLPALDEHPDTNNLQVTGTAVIELLIESNGKVNAANLIDANLPEAYVRALERAFLGVEYTPGLLQYKPVRSRLKIEVSYVDGVLNNLPGPTLGNLPQNRTPHTLIELAPDRHTRKQNPPPRSGN